MDLYKDHAIHCQKQSGFKYRHDLDRDVLYDTLVRARIPAKKEALVNFLTPRRTGLLLGPQTSRFTVGIEVSKCVWI